MLLIGYPTPPYICTGVASEKNCPDSNENCGTRHACEGRNNINRQTNKQTKKQNKQTNKHANKIKTKVHAAEAHLTIEKYLRCSGCL